MAAGDNVDPKITAWANGRVRPLADKLAAAYYALQAYINDYTTQGISATITADGASAPIGDGSDVDGRPRITGTQIINLEAALVALKTQMDTTLISGVGTTTLAIISPIQVNGSPR